MNLWIIRHNGLAQLKQARIEVKSVRTTVHGHQEQQKAHMVLGS